MGYGRVDERTGYGSRPPHDASGDVRFQEYYAAQPDDSGYADPDPHRVWEPGRDETTPHSPGRRGKTADRGTGRPRDDWEQAGPEQSMRSDDRYEV